MTRRGWRTVAIALFALGSSDGAWAGELHPRCDPNGPAMVEGREAFFLGSSRCGSDASFNPLTVLVNNGLDILRTPVYMKPPGDVAWTVGFKNVFENLKHPVRAIKRSGGWREFVSHEVFPYRGLPGRSQFSPNYFLHLLGEGVVYRKLSEWYAAESFPAPAVWGAATLYTALMFNEAAENGSYVGPNWDPVADVYIFNLLGVLLFSIDEVARFFSTTVRINYWPGQAMLGVNDGAVTNQGEDYAFKVSLGDWTRIRPFLHVGGHSLFGVSIPVTAHDDVSIGAGPAVVGLAAKPRGQGRVVEGEGPPNWELAAFWDRDESLYASFRIGGLENPFIRVNFYPTYLPVFGASVGFFAAAGRYEGFAVGLTLAPMPLALGFVRDGQDYQPEL